MMGLSPRLKPGQNPLFTLAERRPRVRHGRRTSRRPPCLEEVLVPLQSKTGPLSPATPYGQRRPIGQTCQPLRFRPFVTSVRHTVNVRPPSTTYEIF